MWGLGKDQLRSNLGKKTCGPAAKVNTTQEDLPYLFWASGTESPVWDVRMQQGFQAGEFLKKEGAG